MTSTCASLSSAIRLSPRTPHFVWSTTTASCSAVSIIALLVSASSRFGVVKPESTAIPCTPMKSMSTCSERSAVTAIGPTSASDGVRTPPISTTVRPGRASRCSTIATCIELVTTVRSGMSARWCASRHVVVPALSAIAWPGSTRLAAACAIASFSANWRRDLASNPGSSVLRLAARGGPAVHLVDQPRTGEYVEVAADRHVRHAEQLGQLAHANGPRRRISSAIRCWRLAASISTISNTFAHQSRQVASFLDSHMNGMKGFTKLVRE